MLQFPPRDTPAWDRYFEQVKFQQHTDIQRLWQQIPQVADMQAGRPATGNEDPEIPSSASSRPSRSSSSHSSGSVTSGSSVGSGSSGSVSSGGSVGPCGGATCGWVWLPYIAGGWITESQFSECIPGSNCSCTYPYGQIGSFVGEVVRTDCSPT